MFHSSRITNFGVSKPYYPNVTHSDSTGSHSSSPCYDSSSFSPIQDGNSRFQMEMVSRISQDVRTSTTTGKIQELRQAISAGEYVPDPAEIAKRILFLSED